MSARFASALAALALIAQSAFAGHPIPWIWRRLCLGDVHDIAFSPKGDAVALSSDNNAVVLVDPVTLDVNRVVEGASGEISYSPDGRYLAVSNPGPRLVDGQDFHTIWQEQGFDTASPTFSADGNLVAFVTGGRAVVYVAATGARLLTIPSARYGSVSLSPDGRFLALSRTDSTALVQIVDVGSGKVSASFGSGAAALFQVVFSPDGRWIAVASSRSHVEVRRTSDWSVAQDFVSDAEASRLAFSPDSSRLALSSSNAVQIYDIASHALLYKSQDQFATHLCFSTDGRTLYKGESRGCDAVSWQSGFVSSYRAEFGSHPRVTVSPDGSRMVVADYQGRMTLLNARTGEKVATIGQYLWDGVAAFDPSSGFLVCTCQDFVHLGVFDAQNGEFLFLLGQVEPRAIVFTPDGNNLIMQVDDRIEVWRFSSWTLKRSWKTSPYGGSLMTLSPDGRFLALARSDPNISVYRVADGEEVATYQSPVYPDWTRIGFTPDGRELAMASEFFWRLTFVKTSDWSVERAMPTPPMYAGELAFLNRGQVVALPNYYGEILFADTLTGRTVATWSGLASDQQVVPLEGGQRMAVASGCWVGAALSPVPLGGH